MIVCVEMDAGLAAVLADVAGFLGAVVGSTVQGRATLRAAKRQAQAAEQQAEAALRAAEPQAAGGIRAAVEGATKAGDEAVRQISLQAQSTRADWLRQQRVDASLALLSAYNDFAASGVAVRNALDNRHLGTESTP